MHPEAIFYCHYSDLPSPMAYMQWEEEQVETKKENLQNALSHKKDVTCEDISETSKPNTDV